MTEKTFENFGFFEEVIKSFLINNSNNFSLLISPFHRIALKKIDERYANNKVFKAEDVLVIYEIFLGIWHTQNQLIFISSYDRIKSQEISLLKSHNKILKKVLEAIENIDKEIEDDSALHTTCLNIWKTGISEIADLSKFIHFAYDLQTVSSRKFVQNPYQPPSTTTSTFWNKLKQKLSQLSTEDIMAIFMVIAFILAILIAMYVYQLGRQVS